jgi:hypothetical protein
MHTLALPLLLLVGPAPQEPATLFRPASDLAAAVAHYEALGLRVARRAERDVRFEPRGEVALRLETGASPAEPLADRPALVVPVDRVAPERRRLEKAGLAVASLVARPSRVESLLVLDPDGHRTILRPRTDLAAVAIPAPGELNPLVVDRMRRYPVDGTHAYHWPKSGGWTGNTKDLEYGGQVFAQGDDRGRCYCCGLTFEVFLDAYRLWCVQHGRPWQIGELDLDGVRKLQRQWFGSAADRSCLHTALVDNGLGFRITDWEQARPGDFVQLWREKGSGHSVIFVGWEREGGKPDGRITGIRYWSTQGSTRGIGEQVESFEEGAGKNRVLRDEFWLCRVGDPQAR